MLKRELAESHTEVGVLTDAFVEARYSPHPVDADHVQRIQISWQQLRRVFQRTKRQNQNDGTDRQA